MVAETVSDEVATVSIAAIDPVEVPGVAPWLIA
jgi:hypothetical protein